MLLVDIYVSLSKASLAPLTVQEWCQIFPEVGPDNTVDDEVDAAVEDGEVAGHKIRQPLLHWSKVEHIVLWAVHGDRNPAIF